MSEHADSGSQSNADADMLRAMGLPSGFARASRGGPPNGPRGGHDKKAAQPAYRGGKHSVARKKQKAEAKEQAGTTQGFVIDSTPGWPGPGAQRGGGAGRGRGGNDRAGRGRGRGAREGGGGGGGFGGGGRGQIFVQEPRPLEEIQPLFRPSFLQDPWAHLS